MSPLLGSKKGCAHDSEDDDTDDSDLEEGEIRSDSDSVDDDTLKVPPEVQAKLDHPERLHRDICFNDKGEVSALLADLMLARHIAPLPLPSPPPPQPPPLLSSPPPSFAVLHSSQTPTLLPTPLSHPPPHLN